MMIALHLSLDAAGQHAVIQTESEVLNIPVSSIVYASSNRTLVSVFRRSNIEVRAAMYSIVVVTEIQTVVTQQSLRGNTSALKKYYSDLLFLAIQNGTMTRILQQVSIFYNSNSTLNSVVLSSSISAFDVFYAATPSPTAGPTTTLRASSSSNAPSIALVSGVAVAAFVFIVTIGLAILKRKTLLLYAAKLKLQIASLRWNRIISRKASTIVHPIDYAVDDDDEAKVDEEEISLQFQDPQGEAGEADRDMADLSFQMDLFKEFDYSNAT